MKNTSALAVLTLVNFGMLMVVLFRSGRGCRGQRAFCKLFAHERLRSWIPKANCEHPSPSFPRVRRAGGMVGWWRRTERSTREAVVFRLLRPDGRPSVKISITERGSRIALSGGIDPTYIVLSAEKGETSLTLTNQDGRPKIIKP